MKVIVLAAGYATRLEPLTLKTSKSLLPVAGKPIIDRILDKVLNAADNVDSVYIVTNAKFFESFAAWLKSSMYRPKILLINDGTTSNETRLGAIKDLELVVKTKETDDDVLVVAGDNLFDFEMNDFLNFAHMHKDGVSLALYDIKSLEAARSFGVLKIDGSDRVISFAEKPRDPSSTLISTGIYYFPRGSLASLTEYVGMKNSLDAPGYYISWLSGKCKVYGFAFSQSWYDIGTIESYKKADMEYLKKEKGKDDKA